MTNDQDIKYTPEDIERLRLWKIYCSMPTDENRKAYFDYQPIWQKSKQKRGEECSSSP